GVVTAAVAAVCDVDDAAAYGDARRRDAVRGLDLRELERAIRLDPQDRDVVAGWVGREEVAAVGRLLHAARRTKCGAGACPTRVEWRPRNRRKRAVGVAIEAGDGVLTGRVVVGVDMPDDGRRGE